MYKVFYNERTVFFIDNDQKNIVPENTPIYLFKNRAELQQLVSKFMNGPDQKNLYICNSDIEAAFKEFAQLFTFMEAAGGFVKSNDNKMLFIFRRNIWDLPKGKLKKNEDPETGAMREVEEECGIQNLKIVKHLENTYHIYHLKGRNILKRNYWFEMRCDGNQIPTPQIEEDITEAVWLNKVDIPKVLENTFPSIVEVLKKAGIISSKQ